MKKSSLIAAAIVLFAGSFNLKAQKKLLSETDEQKEKRMSWWENDRFGMFIHWGLYAMPARGEWIKHNERMDNAEYQKYFDLFNPDLYDPAAWARQIKAAGMKYVVLTTKHHEGFCLFDSKYTAYKATNTQAQKDLVKDYADALRAEGLKVGFYYSLTDWHHPDYTIDVIHPQRLANESDPAYIQLNKNRNMTKYRQYLRDQITELLTNYGKIDILWLDGSFHEKDKHKKTKNDWLDVSFHEKDGHGKTKNDWGSVALLKLIRKLQPGIIVNNRLDLSEYKDGEDFQTPEQLSAGELSKFKGKAWETCQTFSGSWGYHRDEATWKTHRQLLDLLITSVCNGGNLLLNVGPTARGEFDGRAKVALDSLGYWMHANSNAIYGCSYAPQRYAAPEHTQLSYNSVTKRLYVFIYDYPPNGNLLLPGYTGKIRYAQFLHDNSELKFIQSDKNSADLVLNLPARKPNFEIPVIEMELNY